MSEPYLGEIRMFGGNFAPVGWLLCQGQVLPISENEALFTLIGTTYGGDGQNTFGLPNLSSRIPIHQATTYPLAMMGGAEQVTLTQQQLPAHTHQATASNQAGTQTNAAGNVWAGWDQTEYSTANPNVSMAPSTLLPAGGSQPHDNMPPFLVINFIIATQGIYPTQA